MTNKTIQEPARIIPVREECDVLIAGAGTAGCVAAIAAARAGARVVLIEKLPLPSGTMANGGIISNSFCSSYVGGEPNAKRIVGGIPMEIAERVIKEKGCPGFIKIDETKNSYRRPEIVINDPETYANVIAKMLMEAGVKLYLHTFLSNAIMEGDRISGIIIESKAGREAITAKYYIDCTGDADLAYAAGAETVEDFYKDFCADNHGHNNVGKIFGIGNVDLPRFREFAMQENIIHEETIGEKLGSDDNYVRWVTGFANSPKLKEKAIEIGLYWITLFSIHGNTIDFVNGIGLKNINVNDVEQFSNAEIALQERSFVFMKFLRENVPGFENAYINRTGNQLGTRASRIVKCDYSLTNDEIVNSARFDDEIGTYGFHDSAPQDKECVLQNQGLYGLPYRMMLPKGVENLLVAGRVVTDTPKGYMSTRNTISCMIQGQAAGTAAALCSHQDVTPRNLDYSVLRKKLEEAGVYFEPK